MASNMILHTPPNTQHVEKIVFSCKFGLKCGENVRKLPDAPSFSQTQPPRQGLVGAVNLQNTTMASDMILTTPPSTHQVEKWFLETLNCKFGLKSIISCIFSCCVEGNFSFSRFTRKWMGLELRVVISANINSTIAVI